jgi:hypothetical protein
MAVKTKATQMWVERVDSTGSEWIQIGCPTGISGLGGAKSQIDVTCLDSDEMEYLPGMASPGALTINLNFDPAVVSHQELWDLFENDAVRKFAIGFSDGAKTIVPTFDSSGAAVFPTTRSFVEFEGYVADLPLEFALNGVVTSAVSIQRTGARIPHWKTP